MTATRHRGLPALADPRAQVLVLGSLPGTQSLLEQRYYAHPRNHFWWIMGKVFSFPTTLDYPLRVQALHERGVAVWDVLESGIRPGSLDAAIDLKSAVANDFSGFLTQIPSLDRIVFNGAMAERLFRERVLGSLTADQQLIARARLPSTSPANASTPPAAKLAAWQAALRVA